MSEPSEKTKEQVEAYLDHFFKKSYDVAADDEARRAIVRQQITSLYRQVVELKGDEAPVPSGRRFFTSDHNCTVCGKRSEHHLGPMRWCP